MTLNEFIKILLRLQQEGKGEYKMKWCYWSDEGDIGELLVVDEEQKIYI